MDSLSYGSADSGSGEAALPLSVIKPVSVPHRQHSRELAQLGFNQRMLALADDAACPLLEGLKLLCTVSANVDRFFETTMARLKAAVERAALRTDREPGASDSLETVVRVVRELTAAQYRLLNARLLPGLQEQGIQFLRRTDFTRRQSEWVRRYFFREIRPVLTPIGLDPAHPFPRVPNKSLNFAVELHGKDAFGRHSTIAIVQAPRVLPRVIRVPSEIAESEYGFVFLSSLLHAQMDELFPGMDIAGCYQFRVTRNARPLPGVGSSQGLLADEPACTDLGKAVRLEVANSCSSRIAGFLLDQFGLNEQGLYRVDGPVNLVRLMGVPDCIDRSDLKFASVAGRSDTIGRPDSAAT